MTPEQAQLTAPAAPPPASAPSLASTSSITTSLSAGWLLAELELDFRHPPTPRLPDGSLSEASVIGSAASLLQQVPAAKVRVRQTQAKLGLLQADLDQAKVPPEDSEPVTYKLERLATLTDGGSPTGDPAHDDPQTLVEAVTQDVLANLTAASTRLGRAFGLGYDLANTCRLLPDATQEAELRFLFGERIVDVHEALADLASFLPPHAARGVSLSLAEWQYWAANPKLGKHAVAWPQPAVSDALGRQGQVWRSVLSGEKLGADMLSADDYLGALKALFRRLIRGRPWIWLVLVLTIALLGLGIYLLVADKGTLAKIGGIVATALGAAGLRMASLKQTFADVAKEIEAQVWGAELDFAVAEAVTVPPGDWRVNLKKIDTPPPRGLDPHIAANSRTVHTVSNAISQRKPRPVRIWGVHKHLHDKCEYRPLGGSVDGENGGEGLTHRLRLARQLVSNRTLGTHPHEVKPGAPGRILSRHREAGDEVAVVWTFRHARIIEVEEFADWTAAEAESRRSQRSR